MANQSSNKTAYWIIGGVIILAIVGFGGYKLWHHYNKSSMMQAPTTSTNQPTSSPSTQSGTSTSGLPNKTNTTNQQLDQDVQNVQNSLNQLQQNQNTSNQDTANQSQDTPQQ